ncbi:MAG: cation diffusion facilitator family transporter, partial [Cytophagaceae bacterium]
MKNTEKQDLAGGFRKGIRTTLFGMGVNFILALLKLAAGWFGNSYALIADGFESAGDMLNSMVVWMGLKVASKERDEDHPYGHGKAEPLATMAVSLALIAASIIIAVESISNIRHPHPLPAPFTLGVLLFVILLKELMFRYAMKVGKKIGSNAVKADAWHHRSDMLTSLAAFIGISI